MSGLNVDWAIEQLRLFIAGSTVYEADYGSQTGGTRTVTVEDYDELARKAQVVEAILQRVLPDWRDRVQQFPQYSMRFDGLRDVCIRARALLERGEEIEHHLGDGAPTISASSLHPWIWSAAVSLWQSDHYLEAVKTACLKVTAETQRKVNRRDLNEFDLFNQAFSTDKPKPGAARLRRIPDDGSKTFQSVQRGAMRLAEGIFAGIRNPLSHEADQELDEQIALEYLAALSVLARWVDESTVERVEEAT